MRKQEMQEANDVDLVPDEDGYGKGMSVHKLEPDNHIQSLAGPCRICCV